MPQDVYKILKDLELRAVGLDPDSKKMQEGYFVAFRTIGLPIHKDDFSNPYSPGGGNLDKDLPKTPAADPKDAPKTASSAIDENKIAVAHIAKSMQSYLNTFLLTDDKLKMNHEYAVMPGSSKVSDSWYAIITGANGIPMSSELSPAMKASYEAAKAKLMDKDDNPTPRYQAYMKYEDEYKSKVRKYYTEFANAFNDPGKMQMWGNVGKLLHDDIDEALARWDGFGFRHEMEDALANLAAQGTDPAVTLIVRAKNRFRNSLLDFPNVGQLPYTILLPNSWYDVDNDDGWNNYTSHEFHTESHYHESSTAYGGGGGSNVGFWSAGASFNKAKEQKSLNIKTNNLDINFAYAVVDIKRPWLDTSLLNLKNWFLMGDYKKNCISNGTMAQELPPAGQETSFLPSIVTSFILIKNLSIKWTNWQSDWKSATESTSASASFGYGPFAVHGNYSHHDAKRDFSADDTGDALKVPGIQLLGYVSTIVPASPAVDSAKYLAGTGGGHQ